MSSPSAFDAQTPDENDAPPHAPSLAPEDGPESATEQVREQATEQATEPVREHAADGGKSITSLVVPRMLASHEGAVRAALGTAAAGRDFTWPPLTDAVTSLGRAAQFAQVSLDDLLAIVEMTVRTSLAGARQKSTADAVLVYLLRFARQAYYGARAELLEAQAKRGGPTGMR